MPPIVTTITKIIIIVLGLIFIYGLLTAIIPRFMWDTFEGWKATKEPTKAFFISRRITGVVIMVIVVSIFIFPRIMSNQ
jgi:uncharacterized SAM-binding protein YcdF (DUF218 family)